MLIDITTLPKDILNQLPLSIRTFKTVYEFDDLPTKIQHLIRDYQDTTPEVTYKISFDFKPEVSEYSDFKSVDNVVDLVVEYLKNYLLILPGAYPFDPVFGCKLKYHVQTKDTKLRETLIASEIDKVVMLVQDMLNVNVVVDSIKLTPISMGSHTEFNVHIDITINNIHKAIKLDFT